MHTQFLRKFYDIQGTPEGGGLPPTLQDLDNPNYAANKEAAEKAAAETAANEAAEAYKTLLTEARNEDGSLKEGYILGVDGKVSKTTSSESAAEGGEGEGTEIEDTTPEAEAESFFTDVNKLHGLEIKVEYGKDDAGVPIDPLSPQGVYIRDKTIMQYAMDSLEEAIAKKNPRAYAYLLHTQEGGDDESFFSNKSFSLPEYETFKESTELQVSIYKSSLTSRGVDPETAQLVVDKAIKDGKLFDAADKAYKATEADHVAALKRIEDKNKEANEQYVASVNKYNQQVSSAVNEGKGMKYIIPDTDKPSFINFVRENTQRMDDGKFVIVRPIGENLGTTLEALWYEFKKGDLTALVQRTATSQNVKRLKSNIEKSKGGGTGGTGTGGQKREESQFIPLSAIN